MEPLENRSVADMKYRMILNHNVSLQYSEEFHTVIILDQEFMNIVSHYCYPKLPKQPVTTHANHNEHILNRFRNRTDSKRRIWLCRLAFGWKVVDVLLFLRDGSTAET